MIAASGVATRRMKQLEMTPTGCCVVLQGSWFGRLPTVSTV